MTSRDFCYWLQGFMELQPLQRGHERLDLSAEQTVCIRQHLALVFKHEIDPSAGGAEAQAKLDALHNVPGLGLAYCNTQQGSAPLPEHLQQKQAWQQGPRPDGTQVRC